MFDPPAASPNTAIAVAAFITVLKNPHMGASVAHEEQALRQRLKDYGHDAAYIESAVQYAYAA